MIKTKAVYLSLLIVVAIGLRYHASHAQGSNVEVNLDVLSAPSAAQDYPFMPPAPASEAATPIAPPIPAHISQNVMVFPLPAQEDAAITATPVMETGAQVPAGISNVPIPKRKPAFISTDLLAELSGIGPPSALVEDSSSAMAGSPIEPVPPAPVEEVVNTYTAPPPVPPKRPSVVRASETFVKKARAEIDSSYARSDKSLQQRQDEGMVIIDPNAPASTVAPSPPALIKKQARQTAKARDLSDHNLVTPTASDILASIDPDASLGDQPISEADGDNIISLGYLPGVSVLPAEIKSDLRKRAVNKARDLSDHRIEIIAYATAKGEDSAGSARRLSLARALEIRRILIDDNIDPTRIAVRPLGDTAESPPYDRADIQFVK